VGIELPVNTSFKARTRSRSRCPQHHRRGWWRSQPL